MAIQIGSGITIGGGIGVGSGSAAPAGLVASLDAASYSGTGATWYDLSGLGNDFTLLGTPSYVSNGPQSYFSFFSSVAQGGAILSNQAYTKVAVVRTVTGSLGNIISGDSSNPHAFWCSFGPFLQSGVNGNWTTVINPAPIPTNQWFFVAVSFNITTGWHLFLNNIGVAASNSTDTFAANPATVEIGGFDGNSNQLQGDLAIAQIYNVTLPDYEILALYAGWQSRFGL